MSNCPRCGKNHYDLSRPTVPTCPFTPHRTGPGGGRDLPDIVSMCELAAADERYATGALYKAAAVEIRRLRAGLQAIIDGPYTLIGDADSVSACQDLIELITGTARAALRAAEGK